MKFQWKTYNKSNATLVDSWLDKKAVKSTGLSDGWDNFYNYWTEETEKYESCQDFCFIVFDNGKPFSVVYLATENDKMIISEIIIAPEKRDMGYGSALIRELTENTLDIIGKDVKLFEAVIFPSNIASQKAFEKADFKFIFSHSDDDAWHYQKKFSNPATAEKCVDKIKI